MVTEMFKGIFLFLICFLFAIRSYIYAQDGVIRNVAWGNSMEKVKSVEKGLKLFL